MHRAGDLLRITGPYHTGEEHRVASVRMFATDNGYYFNGIDGLIPPSDVELVREREDGNPCGKPCDPKDHETFGYPAHGKRPANAGTCSHCRGVCYCPPVANPDQTALIPESHLQGALTVTAEPLPEMTSAQYFRSLVASLGLAAGADPLVYPMRIVNAGVLLGVMDGPDTPFTPELSHALMNELVGHCQKSGIDAEYIPHPDEADITRRAIEGEVL